MARPRRFTNHDKANQEIVSRTVPARLRAAAGHLSYGDPLEIFEFSPQALSHHAPDSASSSSLSSCALCCLAPVIVTSLPAA